jgi:dihydroorotate dehydrogenase
VSLWSLARPFLRAIPPETAHGLAIKALDWRCGPIARTPPDPALAQTVWGCKFPNPVGIAAGFDKDARVMAPLLRLGFGFVEFGTVTPRPQPGNPKPRLFRLDADSAVINRLGFNSRGLESARARLSAFRTSQRPGIVGANIGRNKETQDANADYQAGARALGPMADYLVVNVSSPNTPGLRDLQAKSALADLLAAVRRGYQEAGCEPGPPVLVKIAPDLDDMALADIIALASDGAMDGIVISNTTTARPDSLQSLDSFEDGGLSGEPLFDPSTKLLAKVFRESQGKVPLIGVGGIDSAERAYAKIRAGATLVQLYTALVFHGPGLVDEIVAGLGECLRRDGFSSISDAVGADAG